MRFAPKLTIGAATLAVVGAFTVTAIGAPAAHRSGGHGAVKARSAEKVRLHLTPSSPQLAACMRRARLDVKVKLTTDKLGFDIFTIRGRHLPPNTDFTTFLIEQAASPFGAAEYIGDFSTDKYGNTYNQFKLIVQEAFSSTLVNGQRVRVDLNQVGAWFADPAGDDFCLGPNSPITPFDGDNQAGVQAFNSAHTQPLPAP